VWVSFGQKWKTETERQHFADTIGPSSIIVTQLASKAIEFGEKNANIRAITPFKVIHWKARSGLPISVNWTFVDTCYG